MPMTEKENELAFAAMQKINRQVFTLSATLDIKKPETINNFALFGKVLADAYDTGRMEAEGDYLEAMSGHNALVRELDVLLNGEEGAAKQASLCDIVAQVRGMINDPEGYVSVMWFEAGDGALKLHQAADEFPFGQPGIDYNPSFPVTMQAVIAVGPITKS